MYRHTQKSPLVWLSAPLWLGEACLPLLIPFPPTAQVVIWGSAAVLMLVTWQFSTLTVRDDEDRLTWWFGPVRMFGSSILYDEIESFAAEKSTWLDGWGLHYSHGGWLWNVWGFDCVRITLERKNVRIGTDDVPGLLAVLKERTHSEHEA